MRLPSVAVFPGWVFCLRRVSRINLVDLSAIFVHQCRINAKLGTRSWKTLLKAKNGISVISIGSFKLQITSTGSWATAGLSRGNGMVNVVSTVGEEFVLPQFWSDARNTKSSVKTCLMCLVWASGLFKISHCHTGRLIQTANGQKYYTHRTLECACCVL